jgi:hypothetical protein
MQPLGVCMGVSSTLSILILNDFAWHKMQRILDTSLQG